MSPARFSIRYLAGAATVLALGAIALPALAQLPTPRTLAELREEVQARADRHAYPVSELAPAEVKEALAKLKSLDRDEWAAAWSAIGDRHLAPEEGRARRDGEPRRRVEGIQVRLRVLPVRALPAGELAREGEGVRQGARRLRRLRVSSQDPESRPCRIPFEGKEIVGYLRLPPNVSTGLRSS